MATYYISKTGSDSTSDGTNPATPYATLGVAEGQAADGDTIEFGDGDYITSELQTNNTGDYIFIDKGLTLKATNTKQVSLTVSDVNFICRINGNFTNKTVTLDGFVFKDTDGSPTNVIYLKNAQTGKGTVNILNCDFTNSCLYGIAMDPTSVGGFVINITENTKTLGGRSFVNLVGMAADCDVTILDNDVTLEGVTSSVGAIRVSAATADSTVVIDNNTLNLQTSGAIGRGVLINNINNGTVTNNTITCSTTVTDTALGININCDDATLSANGVKVVDNKVTMNTSGGHGILVGTDGSTVGDYKSNDGLIYNNEVIGSVEYRAGVGHGIMFGYNRDGNSTANDVSYVALGILCKNVIGGGHFGNYIKNTGISTDNTGSCLQSKGCTGTKYYSNVITLSTDSYGSAFVANTSSGVNNVNVEVESNIIHITGVTPESTRLMNETDSSQGVTYKKNNYLGLSNVTSTVPFLSLGSAISSATWFSTVENVANVSLVDKPTLSEAALVQALIDLQAAVDLAASAASLVQANSLLQDALDLSESDLAQAEADLLQAQADLVQAASDLQTALNANNTYTGDLGNAFLLATLPTQALRDLL